MNIADNVERGAQLLDEKYPDWHERVALPVTGEVMANVTGCVACQVIGNNYGRAMKAIGLHPFYNEAEDYGFNILDADDVDADWEALGAEWTKQVRARHEPT